MQNIFTHLPSHTNFDLQVVNVMNVSVNLIKASIVAISAVKHTNNFLIPFD